MTATVVPVYAAVFALIFVLLSLRVANTRRTMRIALGTAGNVLLERRIRVQGNFAEYVPFALILLMFVELAAWPRWLVQVLCILLLAARLLHAYGVSRDPEDVRFRVSGMVTTMGVFIVSAGLLILGALR